jgi:glycosyltransferase involved in cell wall biosynthesis
MEKDLTLSFCITCKNRFHQIRKTLPQNLLDNKDNKDIIEFVLVDFGSTDGLQEWIVSNFENEIQDGYLKYYYTEELERWHASVAKNTAHILAENRIVVNLDCDNYTGCNGGIFLINKFEYYGVDSVVFHQFSNLVGDGSYGRISLSKYNFLKIGGYDEDFEPAGYQDTNLLLRLWVSGMSYIHFVDHEYNRAISNTKDEGILLTGKDKKWIEMNMRNLIISKSNITSGKLIANQDKKHIGIVENIYTFK